MKTVGELITELQKFKPDMPIVHRMAEKGGGYTDWEMHTPGDNFTGGEGLVVLSNFQPFDKSVAVEIKFKHNESGEM